MGLKVTTDLSVLKGKTLVDFNFNKGNECTITVTNKKGGSERIRIPSYIANAFEMYWSIVSIGAGSGGKQAA